MITRSVIPEQSNLFAPVVDAYGSRLVLVFGNESKNGECPFYRYQCHHCDIGAGEGMGFDGSSNQQRLEFFQDYYADLLVDARHLLIYNSGSTLNHAEMSRETFAAILNLVSGLKNCKLVSLDSREMYITPDNLDRLSHHLGISQRASIILGVESQNDEIRMGKLKKLMTKDAIENAFAIVGAYSEKIGIDFNIVFQPPEVVGDAAIAEAVETLEYGLHLSEKYRVSIDFNFHPYYPSRKSQGMFPKHPRANLTDAFQALMLMKERVEIRQSRAKLFIGWQDEGHDREQNQRAKELERYLEGFDRFNRTQEIIALQECSHF
ncbi:hypothetical protein IQ235_04610 [Oscillatoriales cyanobacterium LEGE 11467]|uniref:Uncharacterized protein n=1 Tax=Zarconia navalis LEGE 11467 TaxID=1828826 RepID=A0A928Z7V1_9CYAN|nr:hypothetical protein [Zarconia navalis]MBE9040073.1 hypothetical protein [Zarconia navalis LEGE 11467]